MRESRIETEVCNYARDRGWLALKFVSPGASGVPDRLLIRQGRMLFVEFKTATGTVSPLQRHWHRRLEFHGCAVHTINSINAGKTLLDSYSNRLTQESNHDNR